MTAREWAATLAATALAATALVGCGGDGAAGPTGADTPGSSTVPTPDQTGPAPTVPTPDQTGPAPTPTHTPETLEVPEMSLEVLAVYPRPGGFTQGLELLADGSVLHSTGLRGESQIRIEQLGGDVVTSRDLPADHFGEGVTVAGDTAYQLTWQSGVVHTWSLPALEPGPPLSISTEGWGLCHDESRDHLWLSDGTSSLHALGLPDLTPVSQVEVTRDGAPVFRLNELECVDGLVWANVWHTDEVVVIDPASGEVVRTHDLAELTEYIDPAGQEDVLNGLAHDPADGTWLVTGKNWDRTFRVDLG